MTCSRVAISLRLHTAVVYLELSGFITLPSKNKWTNVKFLSDMTVDSDHAYIIVNLANFFSLWYTVIIDFKGYIQIMWKLVLKVFPLICFNNIKQGQFCK